MNHEQNNAKKEENNEESDNLGFYVMVAFFGVLLIGLIYGAFFHQ